MARNPVPIRLDGDEKATLQAAANKHWVTLSELMRFAALKFAAYILAPPVREFVVTEPEPEPEPEPEQDEGRHYSATYSSFEGCRANSPYAAQQFVLPPGGSMRKVS